jgi:transposase
MVIWDKPPSSRSVALMMVRPAQNRTREQAAYLEQLIQGNKAIAVVFTLAQDFGRLLRKREGQVRLEQWKAAVRASGVAELIAFVDGLAEDEEAVANGCSLSWSNGMVEGFVNKVQWIKRSSYGQAGFALLQRRVLLHPAADALYKEQSRRPSRQSASAHKPSAGDSRPISVTFAETRIA